MQRSSRIADRSGGEKNERQKSLQKLLDKRKSKELNERKRMAEKDVISPVKTKRTSLVELESSPSSSSSSRNERRSSSASSTDSMSQFVVSDDEVDNDLRVERDEKNKRKTRKRRDSDRRRRKTNRSSDEKGYQSVQIASPKKQSATAAVAKAVLSISDSSSSSDDDIQIIGGQSSSQSAKKTTGKAEKPCSVREWCVSNKPKVKEGGDVSRHSGTADSSAKHKHSSSSKYQPCPKCGAVSNERHLRPGEITQCRSCRVLYIVKRNVLGKKAR